MAPTYPPGPWNPPVLGHALAFRRDPMAFLEALTAQYGDAVHFTIGPRQLYFFNSPEGIRQVLATQADRKHKGLALQRSKRVLGEGLLTSEGALHTRQRRLVQPAFTKAQMPGYGPTMARHAATVRDRWRDGQTVDMASEMMRLTMAIAGEAFFGWDVEGEAPELGRALSTLIEGFDIMPSPLSAVTDRLPLPRTRRLAAAKETLDRAIFRVIAERRASGEERPDLLSILLRAQDTEGDGGGMSDQQLRDELFTMFAAGHETTANALTWTWWLLANHPQIADRLDAELHRVLGDRPPAVADLPDLPFVERVFTEAMRIYPPAYIMARQAVAPVEVEGWTIPAGALTVVSQWVTHRDRRYFPDPLRFDPDRWTPEARAERSRWTYFPFGGGPRACMGEAFAWQEGILLLATLAQRWQVRPLPGYQVGYHRSIVMRPKGGLPLTLEARRPRSASGEPSGVAADAR